MSYADDKVNGFSCSHCGIYFIKEHGYPVLCRTCHCHFYTKKEMQQDGLQKAIHPETGDSYKGKLPEFIFKEWVKGKDNSKE